MTKTEIESLSGRELDGAVEARVFKNQILTREEMEVEARGVWQTQPQCSQFLMGFGSQFLMGFEAWLDSGGAFHYQQHFRRYSTDHNAAAAVLEEIASRGLQGRFADRLAVLIGAADLLRGEVLFQVINAAPADICRAAILAVAGEEAGG